MISRFILQDKVVCSLHHHLGCVIREVVCNYSGEAINYRQGEVNLSKYTITKPMIAINIMIANIVMTSSWLDYSDKAS
ncbi:hypothetical protein KL86SPO_50303 [uncultured Sporomusa sp.]|uniref:Uncharacterized protein n=1 Tax=uncultured Sporomusa sp. TaxID=307249 RepID=A0A212LYB7_9FIRM|nr:hypothetical protein [uncultured Sporomusa sp.]SCM82532.1 hypothetical protein KL86SPO_50303 [uncultured Sporomusa sp.]